jgi:homoserine dehydrogenase
VVGDIMDIARQILSADTAGEAQARQSAASYTNRAQTVGGHRPPPQVELQPMESIKSLYYFRFMALDQPGVLAQISGILGKHQISIAQMIQRGRKEGGSVPLVIMTHTALERDIQRALVEIKALACITEEPVLIRVEGNEP